MMAKSFLYSATAVPAFLIWTAAAQTGPAPSRPAPQTAKAAPRAIVNLRDHPFLGKESAPATLIEFTDYQCPYCRQFHLTTFPELKKQFIDTGKVRFYAKDLPLDFHPNALRAAQAARCAGEQGQFWTLRDIMTRNADKLEVANIRFWATNLNISPDRLLQCVDGGKYKPSIQDDISEALKIGADGTPAFVIARSASGAVDGELLVGSLPYAVFEEKLKAVLTQ